MFVYRKWVIMSINCLIIIEKSKNLTRPSFVHSIKGSGNVTGSSMSYRESTLYQRVPIKCTLDKLLSLIPE